MRITHSRRMEHALGLPGLLRAARFGLALLAAVLAGCSNGSVQTYGELTGTPPAVAISDLLSSPELYLGEEVTVTGDVVQVCQVMGCWFELQAGDRRLMVDLLMGRHFTIPEGSAGLVARVEGQVVRREGVLKLIGRGVELAEETSDLSSKTSGN